MREGMTGGNVQETSRSAYYKDAIPTLSGRQKRSAANFDV
jgi:hypothetical protein